MRQSAPGICSIPHKLDNSNQVLELSATTRNAHMNCTEAMFGMCDKNLPWNAVQGLAFSGTGWMVGAVEIPRRLASWTAAEAMKAERTCNLGQGSWRTSSSSAAANKMKLLGISTGSLRDMATLLE